MQLKRNRFEEQRNFDLNDTKLIMCEYSQLVLYKTIIPKDCLIHSKIWIQGSLLRKDKKKIK